MGSYLDPILIFREQVSFQIPSKFVNTQVLFQFYKIVATLLRAQKCELY